MYMKSTNTLFAQVSVNIKACFSFAYRRLSILVD